MTQSNRYVIAGILMTAGLLNLAAFGRELMLGADGSFFHLAVGVMFTGLGVQRWKRAVSSAEPR